MCFSMVHWMALLSLGHFVQYILAHTWGFFLLLNLRFRYLCQLADVGKVLFFALTWLRE